MTKTEIVSLFPLMEILVDATDEQVDRVADVVAEMLKEPAPLTRERQRYWAGRITKARTTT